MTTEEKDTERIQGPLFEPEKAPFHLSTSADKQAGIDKLVEIVYKLLEQQLVGEGFLKPTEVSSYNINKTRTSVQHAQPINLLGLDREECSAITGMVPVPL